MAALMADRGPSSIFGDFRRRAGSLFVARYLLGAVFLAYLGGTALLYFFGPWQFSAPVGRGRLVAFLVAVHAAFGVGYLWGVRAKPRAARIFVPVAPLVLASALIQLALILPTSHLATGHWLPNPWRAASDLGTVYVDSLYRRSTETPYVNYFRIVASPLLLVAIPWGVFYWRNLGRLTRVVFVLFVISTLSLYVAIGTNSAAGEWMALFPWFVLAAHLSGVHRLGFKDWTTAAVVQLGSALLFVLLFAGTMTQRTGSYVKDGAMPGIGAKLRPPAPSSDSRQTGPGADAATKAKIDALVQATVTDPGSLGATQAATRKSMGRELTAEELDWIARDYYAKLLSQQQQQQQQTLPSTPPRTAALREVPSAPTLVVRGLAAYFSQGYLAVHLSLHEPFVPCYGVGHSLFLQRQAVRLTGDARYLQCSYPVRIQRHGWSAPVYWATIYPWLASDVTFAGTVVVVLLIGWLSGRVWVDVLGGQNPIAVGLLGAILLMLYYFPAHNRMFQTGEGVVGFPLLLLAWAFSRAPVGRGVPSA